jgi:hypothetical protein
VAEDLEARICAAPEAGGDGDSQTAVKRTEDPFRLLRCITAESRKGGFVRYLVAVSTVVLAVVGAGSASAGGWAAVGFEPLPDDTAAGASWKPKIFVKRHGVTPLEGLRPVVTIHETDSGQAESFTAVPTSEAGVYEADVVFPSPGDWSVAIDSGFGESGVTYGPVTIGAGTGGDPGSFPALPIGAAALAIALAVAGAFGIRRLRRLTPASN